MKVSLILTSYKRPHLLDFTLKSIETQSYNFDLEIVVVNDGVEDETATICNAHGNLNIQYVFSGHRNIDGDKYRVAGFANNIGVKKSSGDIIILSCAEVMHMNDALSFIVQPLLKQKKFITTPRFMYFDDSGEYTQSLAIRDYLKDNIFWTKYFKYKSVDLNWNSQKGLHSVKMPYLMGMCRERYTTIGGYDEDFVGDAADDNDFVDRIMLDGCAYYYTEALVVHLYHGKTSDGLTHWENPKWATNYALYKERQGIIVRNKDKEWGLLDT